MIARCETMKRVIAIVSNDAQNVSQYSNMCSYYYASLSLLIIIFMPYFYLTNLIF